jgi:hypothetical protein
MPSERMLMKKSSAKRVKMDESEATTTVIERRDKKGRIDAAVASNHLPLWASARTCSRMLNLHSYWLIWWELQA